MCRAREHPTQIKPVTREMVSSVLTKASPRGSSPTHVPFDRLALMPTPRKSGHKKWSNIGQWALFAAFLYAIAFAAINLTLILEIDSTDRLSALISTVFMPVVVGVPLFVFLAIKVRDLELLNRRLSLIARTDALTACLNRGAFTQKVEQVLEEASPGFYGALLMIDADNFKSINDAFGHAMGDEALTIIARSIRMALRPNDLVGRMGGEEFAVFLPNVSQRQANLIADRIRRCVTTASFTPSGIDHALSVSIGGAVFEDYTSFSSLFRIADRQLYGAKKLGKNISCLVHVGDMPEIKLRQSA